MKPIPSRVFFLDKSEVEKIWSRLFAGHGPIYPDDRTILSAERYAPQVFMDDRENPKFSKIRW